MSRHVYNHIMALFIDGFNYLFFFFKDGKRPSSEFRFKYLKVLSLLRQILNYANFRDIDFKESLSC